MPETLEIFHNMAIFLLHQLFSFELLYSLKCHASTGESNGHPKRVTNGSTWKTSSLFLVRLWGLVFTSDASTSANTIIISPWKRLWRRHKHKDQNCSYCDCAYAYVRTATSGNEIPLGHNTSTTMFTTRGYVWPLKTLDPDYLTPKQFERFG